MSSISPVQANATPAAPVTNATPAAPVTSSIAPVAAAQAPATVQQAGPAATLQLSQKALAHLKHDVDWVPGAKVDAN